MIKKYKQYNESIKSLLVGPTKDDAWKSLGYNRTFDTPEEFLEYITEGLKLRKDSNDSDIIFQYWINKNKDVIFDKEEHSKTLYVSYKLIVKPLKNVFNIESIDIINIISEFVTKNFNWVGYKIKRF